MVLVDSKDSMTPNGSVIMSALWQVHLNSPVFWENHILSVCFVWSMYLRLHEYPPMHYPTVLFIAIILFFCGGSGTRCETKVGSSIPPTGVPSELDSYHSLFPLEPPPPNRLQKTSNFSYITSCYKAVNSKDDLPYCLRRIHGDAFNIYVCLRKCMHGFWTPVKAAMRLRESPRNCSPKCIFFNAKIVLLNVIKPNWVFESYDYPFKFECKPCNCLEP